MKKDSALFYLCSLIEYIGRVQKLPRREVVTAIGKDTLQRIYDYADVFHCEPIAKTADDFIQLCHVSFGTYDNVSAARYLVPDYWTVGEIFQRLIQDVRESADSVIDTLILVYNSWICEAISNYNTDFYYQPRDYLRECWRSGRVLAD